MSAWAVFSKRSSADTNLSNSSSDTDPSSLQGVRCNRSSTIPPVNSQDRFWPLNVSTVDETSSDVEFIGLHRLPYLIHVVDLGFQMCGDQIALEFAHRREHSVVDRKRIRAKAEGPDLLVMREACIDFIESPLCLFLTNAARDDRGEISPAIADDDNLIRFRQMTGNLVFDRFRGDLVAGAKHDQILDTTHDTPGASGIELALIAGVKPPVAQDFRGLLWTIPVTREDIGPADHDLIAVGEFHLDAGN